MPDSSVADVDLVARAQAGDVDAYAALVERYQAFAVGLAAVVTRQPADAEDVAQEAFFKAYHALDRFRPDASFRAWLARIVVNEARNTLAGSQRRQVLHARFGAEVARPTVAASAEEAAVANEQRVALLSVLDGQREDDRAVLMYRYVFDLSEAEMAQALECSNGTVKSRLSRALARLRSDMKKVAPLLAVSPDLGTLLGQSMSGGAGALQADPARRLVAGLLHRIATAGAPGATSSSSATGGASATGAPGATGSSRTGRPTVQQGVAAVAGGIVVLALAAIGFGLSTSEKRGPAAVPTTVSAQLPPPSPPPSPRPSPPPSPTAALVAAVPTGTPPPNVAIVYGDDLTDAQRQELSAVLAPTGPSTSASVSRDELQSALRAAGLPVDGSERAISSTAVTCLEPGGGLSVQTENVTQMPAAAFANALVTAGVTDAAVLIAAPASTPMTGETAFVGVLKAYPLCKPGQALQPARLRVAYAQLHVTAEIAQQSGAWDKAASIVLRSAQAAFNAHGADDATLGAAVDAASAAESVTLDAPLRAEIVAVLSDLAGLEHGTYARGYAIQNVSADQVRVVPLATATP